MKRTLPALLLVALGLLGWILLGDVDQETLRAYHAGLRRAVDAYPVAAPLLAVLAYAVAVAACLPIALWITVALGFAFGTVWGGTLSVIGGTLGAVVTFLVTRTSLGEPLRRWAGPWLQTVERGFQSGMWSYLLVIRLVPVMPAWLTNTVPALLRVPLGVFAATTAIGIAPATYVLASIGAGLAAVFAAGGSPDLAIMTDPAVLGPLLAVSALALVPVAWRWLRTRPAWGREGTAFSLRPRWPGPS
ncbi:TVP38/TMEM64 family protein [Geminicoccus roseus]|uniref:TVP38/TMEM64 family protein n=1 Tax=Geminicoccus roseus TaxID=404900 RepID=UPI0004134BCB|nr:VTT domain-containing protein [Geminicoccus roseus]